MHMGGVVESDKKRGVVFFLGRKCMKVLNHVNL